MILWHIALIWQLSELLEHSFKSKENINAAETNIWKKYYSVQNEKLRIPRKQGNGFFREKC